MVTVSISCLCTGREDQAELFTSITPDRLGRNFRKVDVLEILFSHKNDKKEKAAPFLPALELELRLLCWTGRR